MSRIIRCDYCQQDMSEIDSYRIDKGATYSIISFGERPYPRDICGGCLRIATAALQSALAAAAVSS